MAKSTSKNFKFSWITRLCNFPTVLIQIIDSISLTHKKILFNFLIAFNPATIIFLHLKNENLVCWNYRKHFLSFYKMWYLSWNAFNSSCKYVLHLNCLSKYFKSILYFLNPAHMNHLTKTNFAGIYRKFKIVEIIKYPTSSWQPLRKMLLMFQLTSFIQLSEKP